MTWFVLRYPTFAQSLTECTQTDREKVLVRTIRGEARIAQEQQLDMKSNEIIRVSWFPCQLCYKRTLIDSSQREKTIQARDTKIKQLEEMITKLHKHIAKTGDQSSNMGRQPASDQNILSQVSSPPVPDRDGPVKPYFRYHA